MKAPSYLALHCSFPHALHFSYISFRSIVACNPRGISSATAEIQTPETTKPLIDVKKSIYCIASLSGRHGFSASRVAAPKPTSPPVSEVAAKDEFNSIKNQTQNDVLASLRIPPQLMGIVPQNAGGFGSIREAAQIYTLQGVKDEIDEIIWYGGNVQHNLRADNGYTMKANCRKTPSKAWWKKTSRTTPGSLPTTAT